MAQKEIIDLVASVPRPFISLPGISWDLSVYGGKAKVADRLTADTSITTVNFSDGDVGQLYVKQDGNGGRKLFIDGWTININAMANAPTLVTVMQIGTKKYFMIDLANRYQNTFAAPSVFVVSPSAGLINMTCPADPNAEAYQFEQQQADSTWAILRNSQIAGAQATGLTTGTTYFFRAKALGNGINYIDSPYTSFNCVSA